MRKIFFITSISLLLCSVMFFMACQKDKFETVIKKEIPKALLSATTRTSNPFTDSRIHLVDGMLKFDDYKAFNDTHEALKELASNSELNNATLIETGYNPDTDLDEELAVIPSHPVLQAFAHRLGLRSEEQKEEVAFKAHLQTSAKIEDFRGSPVYSPELQAMLNDNREVGIGNFIVKFITENKIALIYNRDLTVLEQVRRTPVENLKDGFNLNMLTVNDAEVGANDIFDKDAEGQIRGLTGGDCKIDFSSNLVSGNTFALKNMSLGNFCTFDDLIFEWNFGDGTSFIGISPPNHDFNPANYPYTVTLKALCGECAGKTIKKVINMPNPCADLANITFDMEKKNGGNIIDFTVSGLKSGMTATFDFGDQSPITTVISPTFQHTFLQFTNTTGVPVVMTVTIPGCTPVTITKQISIACGNFYGKTFGSHEGAFEGRYWRLSAVIWFQNNIFFSQMGSSSQTYRYGPNNAAKYKKNANFISADLYGNITANTFNSTSTGDCIFVPVVTSIQSQMNDDYIPRRDNLFAGDRFEDNELFSDHHATIGSGSGALLLEVIKLQLVN